MQEFDVDILLAERVDSNVMISGERFGLRQLYDSKVGSLWVITGGPYSKRLAA